MTIAISKFIEFLFHFGINVLIFSISRALISQQHQILWKRKYQTKHGRSIYDVINRERSAHFKSIDDHAITHCEIIIIVGDEIIVGDREI